MREEFSNRAYFPDEDNKFQFPSCVGRTVISLIVEGVPPTVQAIPVVTAMPGPSSTPVSSQQHPVYKPIFSSKRKEPLVNVKIVKADMTRSVSGKPEFERLGQVFIDVNESTANISYISNAVQRKWGSDYILVTADGLEMEDSSGTQGNYSCTLPIIYWDMQAYSYTCREYIR